MLEGSSTAEVRMGGGLAAGWYQLRWWGEAAFPTPVRLRVLAAGRAPYEVHLGVVGSPGDHRRSLVRLPAADEVFLVAEGTGGAEVRLRGERLKRQAAWQLGQRLVRHELRRLGGLAWLVPACRRLGPLGLGRLLAAFARRRLAFLAAPGPERVATAGPYLDFAGVPAPFAALPRGGWMAVVDAGSAAAGELRATLAALPEDAETLVFAPAARPPGLPPQVRWRESAAPPTLGQALAEAGAGRLLLVRPGCRPAAGGPAALLAALTGADVAAAYGDEDARDTDGVRSAPWHRPAWSPVLALGCDYLGGVLALEAAALPAAAHGLPLSDWTGLLWSLEREGRSRAIVHLPRIVSHRPPGRPWTWGPARPGTAARALSSWGCAGEVRPAGALGALVVAPRPVGEPLVSVVIPTRDMAAILAVCLDGLFRRTAWRNLEVVVVDNGSVEPATGELLGRWLADEPQRFRVLRDDRPFNFSALCNRGAALCRGRHLLLLNNDIEVVEPGWLAALAGWLETPGIGFAGARLLYPDRTIQHLGVALGGGIGLHLERFAAVDAPGPGGMNQAVREVAAATGACLLVPLEVYRAVGGLDEGLAVAWNDVDLCLRIRAAGLRGLVVPAATLIHHESKSRGSDGGGAKRERWQRETVRMRARHGAGLSDDPFHSPCWVAGCEERRSALAWPADGAAPRRALPPAVSPDIPPA